MAILAKSVPVFLPWCLAPKNSSNGIAQFFTQGLLLDRQSLYLSCLIFTIIRTGASYEYPPPFNFGAFRGFENLGNDMPRIEVRYDTRQEAWKAIALSKNLETAHVNHISPEENKVEGYSYFIAFPNPGYTQAQVREELGQKLDVQED
ncbi:MAG: hypothetical protein QE263_09590 [Vampirovibrionales bacterium]|nr:hypothetical protein [Vampirovibrionales bacterium]